MGLAPELPPKYRAVQLFSDFTGFSILCIANMNEAEKLWRSGYWNETFTFAVEETREPKSECMEKGRGSRTQPTGRAVPYCADRSCSTTQDNQPSAPFINLHRTAMKKRITNCMSNETKEKHRHPSNCVQLIKQRTPAG